MITTNINTTPPNYEEEINGFYLTQLDRTYDEGVVLSNSSSIGCRPLAFAIKAGTKILINGISLEIYSDAAQSAVEFFITATTLTESINKGSKITIDKENLFLQYQRKTEGQVAGFDIDADGISKGGVEITGWLNSDTLEGATINNLPTALSVKNYVDNSHPAEDQTLQEVTDRGNTTTNRVMIGSASAPVGKLTIIDTSASSTAQKFHVGRNTDAGLYITDDDATSYIKSIQDENAPGYGNLTLMADDQNYKNGYISFNGISGGERMRITSAGLVGIGTTSPNSKLEILGSNTTTDMDVLHISNANDSAKIKLGYDSNSHGRIDILDGSNNVDIRLSTNTSSYFNAGNVGIGTTSPSHLFVINGGSGQLITTDSHQRLFITSSPLHQAILYFGDTNLSSQGRVAYDNNYDDMYFNTAGAEKMRIKSSGNVGIGTTAPSAPLHVNSITTGEVLKLESTSAPYIRFLIGGVDKGFLQFTNTTAYLSNQANGDFNFRTNNTDKLIIKASGNVGIGTTTPTEKLHIVGDTFIDGGLKVNAANIDFTGLGRTDPGVVGRLWIDEDTIKISAG